MARRDPGPALPFTPPEPTVWSVAAFDRRLGRLIEGATEDVHVAGEVAGVKAASSGHHYFTLKDEREEASVEAVLYRSAPVRARKLLVEGARVIVRGRATVFVPRGRLQFVVEDVRPVGRGALLEALERLKLKLASEGLFSSDRKRRLPSDTRVLGVVTSTQGAALADIVAVAFRRGPVRILVAPAPVQGPDAARRMVRALTMLARVPDLDAVIVGRGGGSADDLAAYNDEALVRCIAAMPVPVVSAVGHEIDTSLTDLVADARAATPSEAAELLIADTSARRERLARLDRNIRRAMSRHMAELAQSVDDARSRLVAAADRTVDRRRVSMSRLERRLAARHPSAVLAAARGRIGPLTERLRGAMERRLSGARRRLGRDAARLDAMSPLAVLDRGYAIATDADGRAIRDAAAVARGDEITVRVARGSLRAAVTEAGGPFPSVTAREEAGS